MQEKEVIIFQIGRSFSSFSKRILNLLEDLRNDHQIHFDKLKEAVPEFKDIIIQADYYDNEKFNYLRKKVFDIGGEIKRELLEELQSYDIKLKKD